MLHTARCIRHTAHCNTATEQAKIATVLKPFTNVIYQLVFTQAGGATAAWGEMMIQVLKDADPTRLVSAPATWKLPGTTFPSYNFGAAFATTAPHRNLSAVCGATPVGGGRAGAVTAGAGAGAGVGAGAGAGVVVTGAEAPGAAVPLPAPGSSSMYMSSATENLRADFGCCIRGTVPVTGQFSPSIFQPLSISSDILAGHSSICCRRAFSSGDGAPAPGPPRAARRLASESGAGAGAGAGEGATGVGGADAATASSDCAGSISSVYLPVAIENLRPVEGCCISGTSFVSGHDSSSIRQPLRRSSPSFFE